MKSYPPESLRVMARQMFIKAGLKPEEAARAAGVVIQSDLSGVDSHGLSRLPMYLGRIGAGMVNTDPQVKVLAESHSTLVVDCDNGLGIATVPKVLDLALAKAQGAGVLACTMRNSNHYGVGNYYALKAVEKNMICLLCTNTTPCMAPTGGVDLLIGTNPITVGVPSGRELPVILDMASTNVAMGKLQAMFREKKKIPFGWAITREGRPTDDPAEAVEGSLLPIAGYKGYGLAVIVDLLAAVLAGAAFGPEVGRLDRPEAQKPEGIGHFLLLVEVEKFMPLGEFHGRVDEYIKLMKNSKKAAGVGEIFQPGQIELKKMAERKQAGIAVSEALEGQLLAEARKLGLAGDGDDLEALIDNCLKH